MWYEYLCMLMSCVSLNNEHWAPSVSYSLISCYSLGLRYIISWPFGIVVYSNSACQWGYATLSLVGIEMGDHLSGMALSYLH